MANFTAADVKKLREITGAGMSDCKKALVETDGDFDKAVEILRIKGAKDVGKRAERNALEGLVAVSGTTLVEVNAETDFVAKSAEFIEFAQKVADAAAAAKANTPEELAAVEVDGKPAGEAILEGHHGAGHAHSGHEAAHEGGDEKGDDDVYASDAEDQHDDHG